MASFVELIDTGERIPNVTADGLIEAFPVTKAFILIKLPVCPTDEWINIFDKEKLSASYSQDMSIPISLKQVFITGKETKIDNLTLSKWNKWHFENFVQNLNDCINTTFKKYEAEKHKGEDK